MIVLEDFSKNYGSYKAVEKLSFTARSSRVTALAGLNGAGKTTVLKAVCGIHRPDSGRILIDCVDTGDGIDTINDIDTIGGIDTAEEPEKAAASVGYMSEHAVFPPFFTVYEFLYHEADILYAARFCRQKAAQAGLKKKGVICGFDCRPVKKTVMTEKKTIMTELERVIDLCDLADLADRKIASLSNGQKRRTALARSLLGDPAVLVLDEPASGLDPAQSARMRSLIADLSRSKTVLFSTHLIHEMESLCAEIIILHKGRLAASGTARDLCRTANTDDLETAFLRITGQSAGEKIAIQDAVKDGGIREGCDVL